MADIDDAGRSKSQEAGRSRRITPSCARVSARRAVLVEEIIRSEQDEVVVLRIRPAWPSPPHAGPRPTMTIRP